jgi:DHA2 family multidrug resistance protein
LVTTLVARHAQMHTNILGSHVTALDPAAQNSLERMTSAFIAQGMDPPTAMRQAQAAIFGMVQRHAAMLSYLDAFFLLSIMFIAMLPLVLIMKRPARAAGGAAEAMAH